MNNPTSKTVLSRSVLGMLFVFGLMAALLFTAGYKDYPYLHTILDTGMFLLTAVLALLLWDMGGHINNPFPKNLAVSFAVAALLNFIHVLVTVEWSGALHPIAQAQSMLRPGTWPPTTHMLPIGVGCSVWLMSRNAKHTGWLALGLIALSAGMLVLFNWLPRYSPAGFFGITRPALIFSPLLWAAAGWACWRLRAQDRVLPMLALMSVVLLLANVAQLYSRAPHDTQAMVAHLGRNCGYLVLLVSVMQMAASDMRERIRAERELAQLNLELEQRVVDRTAQLNATNQSLVSEIEVRRQAEAAVRQSEARYRTLFDTLIEGFCTIEMIFDAGGKPVDYRFLEINPAFEKQTGLQNAQGRLMRDLAPDHEAHWFEIYGKIALTGEPIHFENEAKALGRHYDVCAYRIGGPESRKVAILFNDITERKVAEGKIRAQLARLNLLHQITRAIGERQDLQSIFQVVIRSLEDNLPIDFSCVCIHDPSANTLKVVRVGIKSAPTAMELAMAEQAVIPIDENGLSRCVRGQLVYEPDIAQVQFPFPQRLARGGLRSLVIAPLLVESKVFGVLVAARRQPGSFVSGECEFLKQLSEHVALAAHQAQLYTALQQAYDDLRQSQQAVMQQERLRALGQMASGIAHDINNAISPVALYAQSLLEQEPNLSARARGQLEIIERAIDDVAATVARMREFYRQREPQLTLTPVSLNQLVQQVMDLTRARWNDMPQQRGIVIKVETELGSALPAIMAVESEIREALTNLVFNAVDAMPDGGTLTLRTRLTEAMERSVDSSEAPDVCVEVADTGVGMDEDTRRRCLEPFFTTKGERGTGLGLAMVYGVVQRHSADIAIESVVGKGTTVRLSFAPPTAPVEGASQPAKKPRVPARLRILVVDDDPLLLKSLRDTLEADGHCILTANSGQEGIDTFRAARDDKEKFAVVITDLGMPYVDGRKVASVVKDLSPSTPVILLTGWGQRIVAEGDVPPQVDRVLNKPPKLQQLREALAHCCQPQPERQP